MVKMDDSQRAIGGTQPAPGTELGIDDPGPAILGLSDGLDWTGVGTEGVPALTADNRQVDQIFPGVFDLQDRPAGIEPSGGFPGTGQLTQGTAGTEIKMSLNKHISNHCELLQ